MKLKLDDAICAAVFTSSSAFSRSNRRGPESEEDAWQVPRFVEPTFSVKTHRRLRRIMARLARRLNLTEAQRAEIRRIIETERPIIGPLVRQLLHLEQEIKESGAKRSFTEILETRALAAQRIRVNAELAVARERVKVKVYYVLMPEQRMRAGKMIDYLESCLNEPFLGRAA